MPPGFFCYHNSAIYEKAESQNKRESIFPKNKECYTIYLLR